MRRRRSLFPGPDASAPALWRPRGEPAQVEFGFEDHEPEQQRRQQESFFGQQPPLERLLRRATAGGAAAAGFQQLLRPPEPDAAGSLRRRDKRRVEERKHCAARVGSHLPSGRRQGAGDRHQVAGVGDRPEEGGAAEVELQVLDGRGGADRRIKLNGSKEERSNSTRLKSSITTII